MARSLTSGAIGLLLVLVQLLVLTGHANAGMRLALDPYIHLEPSTLSVDDFTVFHKQHAVMSRAAGSLAEAAANLDGTHIVMPVRAVQVYMDQFTAGSISLEGPVAAQREVFLPVVYRVAQMLLSNETFTSYPFTVSAAIHVIVSQTRQEMLQAQGSEPAAPVVAGLHVPEKPEDILTLVTGALSATKDNAAVQQLIDMYTEELLLDIIVDLITASWPIIEDRDMINSLAHQEDTLADQDADVSTANATAATADEVPKTRKMLTHETLAVTMPPNFTPQPASARPRAHIPVVFHFMYFRGQQANTYGPAVFLNGEAARLSEIMIQKTNLRSTATGFTFFVKEVRASPATYPYLVLGDGSDAYLNCLNPDNAFESCAAFQNAYLNNAVDRPKNINVYVAYHDKVLGYASLPQFPSFATRGHVFMRYDQFLENDGLSTTTFEEGPNTMWHEFMHYLGALHVFDDQPGPDPCARDGDQLPTTPIIAGPVYNQPFGEQAKDYCEDLYQNKFGGNWQTLAARWAAGLQAPSDEYPAFADSCPTKQGRDPLGNWITYTYEVCQAVLGHLLPEQAQFLHDTTDQYNNAMYVWGQYYALNNPTPGGPGGNPGTNQPGGNNQPAAKPPPAVPSYIPIPSQSGSAAGLMGSMTVALLSVIGSIMLGALL